MLFWTGGAPGANLGCVGEGRFLKWGPPGLQTRPANANPRELPVWRSSDASAEPVPAERHVFVRQVAVCIEDRQAERPARLWRDTGPERHGWDWLHPLSAKHAHHSLHVGRSRDHDEPIHVVLAK